jgi:hypothetical protein
MPCPYCVFAEGRCVVETRAGPAKPSGTQTTRLRPAPTGDLRLLHFFFSDAE